MKNSAILKEMATKLERDYGEHETAKNVTGKIRRFGEALGRLDHLKANPDPYSSEAANTKKLHDAAKQAQVRFSRMENELYAEISNRYHQLEQTISEAADLTPKPTDSETRQVLREMPHQDRIETVMSAAQNGDSAMMSAIASGNEFLTGLDSETRQRALEVYKTQKAPDEMRELQGNKDLMSDVIPTMSFVGKTIKSAMNPGDVQAANEASQQAAKIQAQFNTLLNDQDLAVNE